MNKIRSHILLSTLICVLLTLFTSCQMHESWRKPSEPVDWAIYWYLCGSDLESKHGSASADIDEMLEIKLPENIKVVIETGGASDWTNKMIKSDRMTRFVYSHNGLKKIQNTELSNMGAQETLHDFLKYCHEYHPAKNSLVILWNHGGGALGGVAYDEIYGLDSISMRELQNAFSLSFPDITEPVFDIIGFDACLMANIDTANTVSPYAKYMVASQELEPGNGWNYSGILKSISENPEISPEELGIAICDSFMEDCIEQGTSEEATLSLIDLAKADTLFDHFSKYGDELFIHSLENETLFAALGRAANSSERYGGNNKEEGYTNMVDIGGFFENISIKNSDTDMWIHDALSESVIYQVKGPYRSYGSGLSCYYPFDNALTNLYLYKEGSTFDGYSNLYQYQISGKLSNSILEYLEQKKIAYNNGEDTKISIELLGLNDHPVQISKNNEMILDIGNKAHHLKRVDGYLAWLDMENNLMLGIGNELVENADWENGIFSYPFRTKWFYIDDHLLYTFFIEDQEEYNLYTAPIILNGERVFLRIAENTNGTVEILGARKELGYNGMADKQLIQLKEGDEVATLFYQTSLAEEDLDLSLREYECFRINTKPSIMKQPLMNGIYVWTYDMVDMWDNYATSSLAMYELYDNVASGL